MQVEKRILYISSLSVILAFAAGWIARLLVGLINLITNISFFGRVSVHPASPADNHLGWLVLFIPVIGAVIVGIMARYGSKAIRGHGIPEAMEQILTKQSVIPARLTLLKPVSAAISIGTGGPFGAEGPIIATGGALGSLIGQFASVTAKERRTLLAAGAAAGMTAIFGTPVSAVLLAIELLLFEFRPSSFIPIALATATAAGVRIAFVGGAPVFPMPDILQPSGAALAAYIIEGLLVGIASVYVTKLVYWIEDGFEELPIHWMWWPALGAVAVGLVGVFAPHTLGVGYDNIERILSGEIAGRAMVFLCVFKLISWSISLGSGTSGGTLAPLFTIGGGLGAALGELAARFAPGLGADPSIAALVGMAAIFAGASRALLASVVFAFEATRQPLGLLPLLGGCAMSYLVSALFMRHTIMTEKIERRGVRVPAEYSADFLEQVSVGDCASGEVRTLPADWSLEKARAWIASGEAGSEHQGFPVVDSGGRLMGVLTRRDLASSKGTGALGTLLRKEPVTVTPIQRLREAADLMADHSIGRLLVVSVEDPRKLVGILTRSDIIGAHVRRLSDERRKERSLTLNQMSRLARISVEGGPQLTRDGDPEADPQ